MTFVKGHIPWNKGIKRLDIRGENNPARRLEVRDKISMALKGKKLSLEHRKKLSQARIKRKSELGYLVSLETRRKISEAMKGERANFWKGGITPRDKIERQLFIRTIRSKVFERDNYTCQLCGIRGADLQVDHIQSWADYVELRFNMNNCRTLCARCHYQITFGKPMPQTVKTWGHNFRRRILQ